MLYKLTNISGGQIVCDLAQKGSTLRLDDKKTQIVKDSEITPHIKNLVLKGLILSEEIKEIPKKTTVSKNSKKDKEE